MTTLAEWQDQQDEAELANIRAAVRPDGKRHPFVFPLRMEYDDGGRPVNTIRHPGPRLHDLDYEALGRMPEGSPIPQDVIVYMAISDAMPDGTYELSTREATASKEVAVAAGTGHALRVLIRKGTVLEYAPINPGDVPAEEVLLPEIGEIEVYPRVGFVYKDTRFTDAEFFDR